jgi:arsenate reductase
VSIPLDDPKIADDTAEEAATYDQRCQQICREMLYLFSQVGN